MAMTLAMLVAVMTASSRRKLPKVSWPIESENDRKRCRIAAKAGMMTGSGLQPAIYQINPFRGNKQGNGRPSRAVEGPA
jgi:hypothetical protein